MLGGVSVFQQQLAVTDYVVDRRAEIMTEYPNLIGGQHAGWCGRHEPASNVFILRSSRSISTGLVS